ncbi:hypothetical protein BJ878DRAFT_234617 [Calycina marina]|uniref:C2H2-type domain-containing protein n=1 Tax=Calycina marina TaxID=1763456 RepID=A0A9P7YX58_9HELO|nr:hypothetical protein BJ878DRAFT_234617 [Calycina marina]
MASQSSFIHDSNQTRVYYHSHDPTHPSEAGHESPRGTGPSFVDFPPQPVEVELSNSRTLPNPTASTAAHWDYPSHASEISTGHTSFSLSRQYMVDSQSRYINQAPLIQWYTEKDDPWVPKGVIPEDRTSMLGLSNRNAMHARSQIICHNATNTDSAYGSSGARPSNGNASIFSADITDKDQNLQSMPGANADYQHGQGFSQSLHDTNGSRFGLGNMLPSNSFSNPQVLPASPSTLVCHTCNKPVKTKSELKKHNLRHTKPFHCEEPDCAWVKGFSTINDLKRHTKSKHPAFVDELESDRGYRCRFPKCKSFEKFWPRLDNFKSHLKRVHHLTRNDECDKMLHCAEFEPASQRASKLLETTRPVELPQPLPWTQQTPATLKPVYPDITYVGTLDSSPSISEDVSFQGIPALRNDDVLDNHLNTVKPSEVCSSQHGVPERRLDLANVLAPVSLDDSEPTPQGDQTVSQLSKKSVANSRFACKVPQQEIPTSDIKLMEIIKTALIGAKPHSDELGDGQNPHAEMKSISTRSSSLHSWLVDHAEPLLSQTKPATSSKIEENGADLDYKIRDVLNSVRISGYIIREPALPRLMNPGSAASIRSECLVTCQECHKFKGRPCELKCVYPIDRCALLKRSRKHMKRHSRPYGCTLANCKKTFGSKNDWKRHENSQHFHLETWRCDVEKPKGGICAKVCYDRRTFQQHLYKIHATTADNIVKQKLDRCRLGSNCQTRFWCGFCSKLVHLAKRGTEAWTERFDHIDNHFMGRHDLVKRDIRDWVAMDVDRARHESLQLVPDHENVEKASSSGSSSSGISDDSAHARSHAAPLKRKRSGSSDGKRTGKKAMANTVVYCCQCGVSHNPKFDQRCTEDSHPFCESCVHESRTNSTD